MQPITPVEVLMGGGTEAPEFVIEIVNDCLIDAASSGISMSHAEEIFLHRDMLRTRVLEAAGGAIEDLVATNWENFPYYYAKDWDIKLPGCEGGAFHDYYIFSPKGLSHKDNHEH